MKYTSFIRGVLEIGMAFYFWFNWENLPKLLIFFICLVFALEGVTSLMEAYKRDLQEKLDRHRKELAEEISERFLSNQ